MVLWLILVQDDRVLRDLPQLGQGYKRHHSDEIVPCVSNLLKLPEELVLLLKTLHEVFGTVLFDGSLLNDQEPCLLVGFDCEGREHLTVFEYVRLVAKDLTSFKLSY